MADLLAVATICSATFGNGPILGLPGITDFLPIPIRVTLALILTISTVCSEGAVGQLVLGLSVTACETGIILK